VRARSGGFAGIARNLAWQSPPAHSQGSTYAHRPGSQERKLGRIERVLDAEG
jgi:hypothetical protein